MTSPTDSPTSDSRVDALVADAHPPLGDDTFDRLLTAATAEATGDDSSATRRRRLTPLVVVLTAAAAIAFGAFALTRLLDRPETHVTVRNAPDVPAGGVVFVPDTPSALEAEDLRRIVEVVRARLADRSIDAIVSNTGVRIVVSPKDPDDRDEIVRLVTARGDVQFRPVLGGPVPRARGQLGPGPISVSWPADQSVLLTTARDATGGYAAYTLGPAGLGSEAIEDAVADDSMGRPGVQLTFAAGPDGIDAFNALASACYSQTQACPQGLLAIVVDGTVLSAPRINAPSFERNLINVSGEFTPDEARELASILDAGELPFPLKPV